jgi:hypothetical protein
MKKIIDSERTTSLNVILNIKNSNAKLDTLTDTDLLANTNEVQISKQTQNLENLKNNLSEIVEKYKLNITQKEQDIENK